jgi:hypothetical protein
LAGGKGKAKAKAKAPIKSPDMCQQTIDSSQQANDESSLIGGTGALEPMKAEIVKNRLTGEASMKVPELVEICPPPVGNDRASR